MTGLAGRGRNGEQSGGIGLRRLSGGGCEVVAVSSSGFEELTLEAAKAASSASRGRIGQAVSVRCV